MGRTVRIIGAPMDYGANRRGVDMGPSAIRYADLAEGLERAGVEAIDDGDISMPRAEERDPDAGQPTRGNAKFLREIEDVCSRVGDRVAATLADGAFPLVLGGDHSVAIGSLNGSARDTDLGAIWFDAHADLNTPETSPSGNVHGMPLAAALGRGAFGGNRVGARGPTSESSIAYVGLRSIDERERELIQESEMTAFTMSDIDQRGSPRSSKTRSRSRPTGPTASTSASTSTGSTPGRPRRRHPVRGVTYREAHAALEAISRRDETDGILRSMDVVEVNPILDEANETGNNTRCRIDREHVRKTIL